MSNTSPCLLDDFSSSTQGSHGPNQSSQPPFVSAIMSPTPAPQSRLPLTTSRLLSIPVEIRLIICSYMTLSPVSSACLAWKGAFFACRQLQQNMLDKLKPDQDLPSYVAEHEESWKHDAHPLRIEFGPTDPFLCLVRSLTIYIPIPFPGQGSCCISELRHLYPLYLEHLTVVLTGHHFGFLPYEDLKSWNPIHFLDFVRNGEVKCKKVTFTIEGLANREGGKANRTKIENLVPETNIPYVLEIVQDVDGRQTERSYESLIRFGSLPTGN